jgi:hypothetical protein
MADSTLFNRTVAHNDAFRETLLAFEDTRSLPTPEEPSPAWRAWEAARSEAFMAVIASVDHYCAGRVLEVLTAVTQEIEQGRGTPPADPDGAEA